MMAQPGDNTRFSQEERPGAQKSGVLVLLYPHEGEIYLPLIIRPEDSGPHSGQVAFPGGRMEKEDVGIIDTAVRETWEEIGVAKEEIIPLGCLTNLYIPVSNYIVSPVLGYTHTRPFFKPDEREVAGVIEVPLSRLNNPDCRKKRKINVSGFLIDAPYFEVDDQMVWGATAMMLSEFLEILNEK